MWLCFPCTQTGILNLFVTIAQNHPACGNAGAGAIARPIVDEDTELTPAWLTTALNERGNLPAGITVTSLRHLNLGEG
jgi:hypothetical protein